MMQAQISDKPITGKTRYFLKRVKPTSIEVRIVFRARTRIPMRTTLVCSAAVAEIHTTSRAKPTERLANAFSTWLRFISTLLGSSVVKNELLRVEQGPEHVVEHFF